MIIVIKKSNNSNNSKIYIEYIPWSSNGPRFGGLSKGPEIVDRDLKAGEGTFDPLGGLAVGRFSRDVNDLNLY